MDKTAIVPLLCCCILALHPTGGAASMLEVNKVAQVLPRFQEGSIRAENMSEQMVRHKQQIEVQEEALDSMRLKKKDVAQRLHEVEILVETFKSLQDTQKKAYDELIKQQLQFLSQMSWEMAEKEERIAQLTFRILKRHRQDPFIETYQYPMSQFWVALDSKGQKSAWEYKRSGQSNVITQENDVYSTGSPATSLVLKSHRLSRGFVYADILLKQQTLAVRGGGAAGIVFKVANAKNFWMVKLSRVSSRGKVALIRVVENIATAIAEAPIEVSPDTFYGVACEYTSKGVSVFINGKLRLDVDLASTASEESGSAGLFTSLGKAYFKNFVAGPVSFEMLAPQGSFQEVHESSTPLTIRKVTNEKELKAIKGLSAERFKQMDIVSDSQVVARTPRGNDDFEYTKATTKENFFPNSPLHVPDAPPRQEVYNGYFHNENALFRQPKQPVTPAIQILPGIPQCRDYDEGSVNIADWESTSGVQWRVTKEMGLNRFTPPELPGSNNQGLLLEHYACNSAEYMINLTLQDHSRGGLAFRADDNNNKYIACVDTDSKTIELLRQVDGHFTLLQSVQKPDLSPQMRHRLLVIDEGAKGDGQISVFLDEKPYILLKDPYQRAGRTGAYLQNGHISFDSFKISTNVRNVFQFLNQARIIPRNPTLVR